VVEKVVTCAKRKLMLIQLQLEAKIISYAFLSNIIPN